MRPTPLRLSRHRSWRRGLSVPARHHLRSQTRRTRARPRAEQGNAKAQYNLGAMYANGLGVPQDYATTVSWYRRAAEQGLVEAQCKLGVMYAKGQGVPQNYAVAASWFLIAAEQGDAWAQDMLGLLYEN